LTAFLRHFSEKRDSQVCSTTHAAGTISARMGGLLSKIGNAATRVESWWALVLLIASTGFFSWVGSQWAWLMAQGWAVVIFVAFVMTCLGLLSVSAVLVAIRHFRLAGAPQRHVPFDEEHYSPHPAIEAPNEAAYDDLLRFFLWHLLPACDAQIALQRETLAQQCFNPKLAEYAKGGLEEGGPPAAKSFWVHYNNLVLGLECSYPQIKFESLIDGIKGLERGGYRDFCAQVDAIAKSGGQDPRRDAKLKPLWLEWCSNHNKLIEEYEKIRIDHRFPRLFQPRKSALWGTRCTIGDGSDSAPTTSEHGEIASIAANKEPQHDDKSDSRTVTLWNADGLYVGEMGVDTPKLANDYYIEFWVRGFNATGTQAEVRKVTGSINYREDGNTKGVDLPTPQLFSRGPESFPNFAEIFLVFGQRVPSETAKRILEQLAGGDKVLLNLNSLNVQLPSHAASPSSAW
jgi:hypothetical protein